MRKTRTPAYEPSGWVRPFAAGALLLTAPLISCGALDEPLATSEAAISSATARILEFEFEGEVIGRANVEARKAVVSQLMYVQGVLTTARHGNGQIGNVKLSEMTETAAGDTKRITYRASLPVAWPEDLEVPEAYTLTVPRDVTTLPAFDKKYSGSCGAQQHGSGTFWHDFDPRSPRCNFVPGDVVVMRVAVGPHPNETKNKYPEYDQFWADDRLDVVAIFGLIEKKQADDYGYSEATRFIRSIVEMLDEPNSKRNETSKSILTDVTITGKAIVGGRARDVNVDVIVVQKLERVGPDFDARYDTLSEKADIVMYNGHTESGQGINTLARKGKVAAGKYQLFLLNGCQSFALIDSTMTDRRRDANGLEADPAGTRFLEVIGNALPGYAHTLASVSATVFAAAVHPDEPKNYNALMSEMPKANVVVVFGEEDNRFEPR